MEAVMEISYEKGKLNATDYKLCEADYIKIREKLGGEASSKLRTNRAIYDFVSRNPWVTLEEINAHLKSLGILPVLGAHLVHDYNRRVDYDEIRPAPDKPGSRYAVMGEGPPDEPGFCR
jgi:hypothetical protein